MRKTIILIFVLIFELLFSSCSITPESAVKTFLDDVKNGTGLSILEHLTENSILPRINIGDKPMLESDTAEAIETTENLIAKIQDFDYEIIGHKNNEDGTVDVFVEITTYDFADILIDVVKEILKDAMSSLFSEYATGEESFDKKILDSFNSQLAKAEKDYKDSVVVKVEKNGLKWDLVKGDANKDLLNAISGGIIEAADSLISIFK